MKTSSYLDSKPKPTRDGDKFGQLLGDVLHEFAVVVGIGASHYVRLLYSKFLLVLPLTIGLVAGLYYSVQHGYHLQFLYILDSQTFDQKAIDWLWEFNASTHFYVLLGVVATLLFICLGFRLRYLRTKYQKLFQSAGITNKLGDTPVLLSKRKLDSGRIQYIFDAKGIGLSLFESKMDNLESSFGQGIESVCHGENQGQIVITLTKRKLPSCILYEELVREKSLKPYNFYVGYSSEGVITQSISDLPHMLIAGTTGAGKSVFFKQVLLGLLESSPYLQMYLIDLKGGLEMADFKSAPNVKVIKDMSQACSILRKIQNEMDSRFGYLEKKGLKQINPVRDKKDRIIVAVDEASVLYMTRKKTDAHYQTALEARQITDSIAKLSRAAAIHLILATQKVSKETIDTNIQENISARMCFKMNTLQGSLIVLGTKEAMEIPDTRGRGIWSLGNKRIPLQGPYINEEQIKEACERVSRDYQSNRKTLMSPMIGDSKVLKKMASELENNLLTNDSSGNDKDGNSE